MSKDYDFNFYPIILANKSIHSPVGKNIKGSKEILGMLSNC
jgi:hypothetical protein